MLGLLGALNMASRSLATQRQGAEVAGHNLANVNNPAYARQRLQISTALTLESDLGPQGTGVDAVRITQFREALLDRQIQAEASVRSSLEAQQSALQWTQSAVGQSLDRQTAGVNGAAADGSEHPFSQELADFFNAFQSLSTNPTSMSERQVVLMASQNLTVSLNAIARRLGEISVSLDESISGDVGEANLALADIAQLNGQIVTAEVAGKATANDLRDLRQKRIEDLTKLIKVDTAETTDGAVSVTAGGIDLVDGPRVITSFEAFDEGDGHVLVRAKGGSSALSVGGGSIHGTLTVRDGELSVLRQQMDAWASGLIQEVNAIHRGGFGLKGSTGAAFFTGDTAANIQVNALLMENPALVQASQAADASGDNQGALALAKLGENPVASLGGRTFSGSYNETISQMGQALASVSAQLGNQDVVERMLLQQRDSASGVSLDEEMMDLMKFQKAFDASARLVVTIGEMLDTVINLKR